jgi:hypothetical protein
LLIIKGAYLLVPWASQESTGTAQPHTDIEDETTLRQCPKPSISHSRKINHKSPLVKVRNNKYKSCSNLNRKYFSTKVEIHQYLASI